MDQQHVLSVLREELRDAEKRLRDTSDYLDLAIQINRNPCPTAHTQERVRLAARAYRLAVEDHATALSRLNRSTMDNVVPEMGNIVSEDLKRRGPRKAQTMRPASLRQLA